jgi:dTDP-4-dehydrorhamnose 3,5-epimerase
MKKILTEFDGVFEIDPQIHVDHRGYFYETFSTSLMNDFKVEQVNVSLSMCGTIRGIHYARTPPGQMKYVQCVDGEILDVVVDLRRSSATFGKWIAITLSSTHANALFIPNGFGHAFQALSDTAKVMYLCSSHYNPSNEFGIHPLDPEIAIPWPITSHILSARDMELPRLDNYIPIEFD